MRLAACPPLPTPPGSCGTCRQAHSPPRQPSPAMPRSSPAAARRPSAGPRWPATRNAESRRNGWTNPCPAPTDGRCSAADAHAGLRPACRIAQRAVHGCPHRDPPQPAPGRLLQRPPRPRQAAQTVALVAVRCKLVALADAPPLREPPLAGLRALRTGARMNPQHFQPFMEITLDFRHGCS